MVTEGTLARARAGDEQAFRELTDPYRAELLAHCYQILGSVADAEDMLQETLLAAWRGLNGFEGRSSLRSWLHRIAVNGCLNALRDRSRRPREVPLMPELPQPTRMAGPVWVDPYPDVLLDGLPDAAPGPEARYDAKEAVELAFVTALQHLPPRQRAVLVLRDVLGYPAAEAAGMLGGTKASVKGAPLRLVPTRANTQPAFGCYLPCAQAPIARPYGMIVLTLTGDQISAITWFSDSSVFPHFGLPRALPQ